MELGPRYGSECFSASLTGHYTHLSDVVGSVESGTVTIPGQGTFIASRNANIGRGYVAGVEAAAAWEFSEGWTLFGNGTYTFALRAHNAFNLWSGRSATATATVSNENTQGPPPPINVAATENPIGCLRVTWTRVGDATITGYRMYFATRSRTQGAYTDSVDVGPTATACLPEVPAERR